MLLLHTERRDPPMEANVRTSFKASSLHYPRGPRRDRVAESSVAVRAAWCQGERHNAVSSASGLRQSPARQSVSRLDHDHASPPWMVVCFRLQRCSHASDALLIAGGGARGVPEGLADGAAQLRGSVPAAAGGAGRRPAARAALLRGARMCRAAPLQGAHVRGPPDRCVDPQLFLSTWVRRAAVLCMY